MNFKMQMDYVRVVVGHVGADPSGLFDMNFLSSDRIKVNVAVTDMLED